MTPIELLAPARTADIGIEAVRHGADAVYIGAEAFGARAAAGNSVEDIGRLVAFAHQFGASVYVTVNTLIREDELEAVEQLCWKLWEVKVDALIVQDLQLLNLNLPPIPLHASTQMDNRTAEKVKWLSGLGFNQVVLARELSMEDVARIHQACPDTALEVFVHGALCVSLSGLCNVSEVLFHRSANRGECAQVCRMEMDLLEDECLLLSGKNLLSLRDNCQLNNLENLLLAGATSLKIEGRLKGMDYVKNITAAYSQALDAVIAKHPQLFRRKSAGHVRLTFQPNVWKSFNRGFVRDATKPDANIDTPKSMGEPLCETSVIHNGDGLCYMEHGRLVGFRVNNAEQFRPQPHIQYYRNQDTAWDKLLSKPSADRRVWVDIDMYADHICMTDEAGFSSQVSIHAEEANTPQADNIKKQLAKLGSTIYEAREIRLHDCDQLFIPSSQLAAWRRTLTQQLDTLRQAHNHTTVQPHNRITEQPLMQTKYCLRRQLGKCLKEGTTPANWTLRLKNGKLLKLQFDCRQCLMKVFPFLVLLLLFSCVGNNTVPAEPTADTIVNIVDTATVLPDSALIDLSPQQMDSLTFRLKHHYSENFNFVVKADSFTLIPRPGDFIQDTCRIYSGDLIAVAAISQQMDTTWLKVAHDQQTMGWITETELLQGVSPSDPISQMLYTLSSLRAVWMSLLVAIGLIAFFIRLSPGDERLRAINCRFVISKIVNRPVVQLPSPYPRLFIAITALMACTYASVQNFLPEYWQEYYFHPTLNPLILPPIMALLVVLVWLLIITFIAVCDEAYHKQEPLPALTTILELIGLGMITYLIISWTTLYYIGYVLILALFYKLNNRQIVK